MLKDALSFWNAIEGKVRETVKAMSGKNLQCERYDVSTAPDGGTGRIGVKKPFGDEILIPYSRACANAAVGDTVIVVWWKSLSNAKAWYMADAIGEGGGSGSVQSVNGKTGVVELDAADVDALPDTTPYAGSAAIGGAAELTVAIPFGAVDSTSTATAYTATVPGVHELRNGVVCYIRNDAVTSTTNCTLNVNGLGAKPIYVSNADATRVASAWSSATTWLFIYNESRVSGGCWDAYYGQVNSNTIGYQLRTNSSNMTMSDRVYRYRLLFTSADGQHFVPANTSTSTNATATRSSNTTPIDPFGEIVYYGSTTALSAGGSPSATVLWQQYVLSLGYSFNNTGAALALTTKKPVYITATPQSDGSAVLDYFTQTLPSTNDGKIYIFLGIATSATEVELRMHHPVYWHDGTGVREWTGAAPQTSAPTLYNKLYYETTDATGNVVLGSAYQHRIIVKVEIGGVLVVWNIGVGSTADAIMIHFTTYTGAILANTPLVFRVYWLEESDFTQQEIT